MLYGVQLWNSKQGDDFDFYWSYSLILWVRVVLYRTFVSDKKQHFNNLSAICYWSQKELQTCFQLFFHQMYSLTQHYFQLIRMGIELKLFKFNQVEYISTFSILELSCVRSMHCQGTTCSPSTWLLLLPERSRARRTAEAVKWQQCGFQYRPTRRSRWA